MQTCPHCRAELRENARFCPACMTPLNEKRVIPTPKYVSLRWLSATGAVLVLAAALWGVEQGLYTDPPPVTDTIGTVSTTLTTAANTTLTTAASTTLTTAASTTLTTAVESLSAASTTVTTVAYTNFLPVYPSTAATEVTSGRVPSFLTTAGTTRPTSTTRSTTKAPTTTTKAPTTTTTTTRPYWQDVTPASFTEDGLPIEEVTWTYEPINSTYVSLPRCNSKNFPHLLEPHTERTATPSGVPLNQCIMVTGCIGSTSNGIYRVPAMIDGKVVAAVEFRDSFADTAVAQTVKRIYLPPDLIWLDGGLETCTKLESLYVTSPDCWFSPKQLPNCGSYTWGGVRYYNLSIHVPYGFNPIYIRYYSPEVWPSACKGNVYNCEAECLTDEKCAILYGGGVV